MFYTASSEVKKAYQLIWFGSVIDNNFLLAVYETKGCTIEIITDNKGNYINSKIMIDEHI